MKQELENKIDKLQLLINSNNFEEVKSTINKIIENNNDDCDMVDFLEWLYEYIAGTNSNSIETINWFWEFYKSAKYFGKSIKNKL